MSTVAGHDIARLCIIAAMSVALGFGINALRRAPLPLRYEAPAARLARATQADAPAAIALISLEEMRELAAQRDVLLLDARADLFYQIDHIPGAANLPKEGFAEAFALIEPPLRSGRFRLVVIYCSGGDCEDSVFVAAQLSQRGIGPLAIFEGGWEAWQQQAQATQ